MIFFVMDRLVDVIKEGEIIRMSESRALEEDLFILRAVELKADVLSDDYGLPKKKSPYERGPETVKTISRLQSWRAGKVNKKSSQIISDLVQNFHWEILKARRSKGVSRMALAQAVGTSEENIKTLELGELPSDDFVLISKIENHLGIKLRKNTNSQSVNLSFLQKQKEEEERKNEEPKVEHFMGSEIEIVD